MDTWIWQIILRLHIRLCVSIRTENCFSRHAWKGTSSDFWLDGWETIERATICHPTALFRLTVKSSLTPARTFQFIKITYKGGQQRQMVTPATLPPRLNSNPITNQKKKKEQKLEEEGSPFCCLIARRIKE